MLFPKSDQKLKCDSVLPRLSQGDVGDVMLITAIGGHVVKTLKLLHSQPFQGQYSFKSCCLYTLINI